MLAPQLPDSSDFRFTAHATTRWSDEDNMKVVNHTVLLTLIEEARWQYGKHLGLIDANTPFAFVLGQTCIRFLAPGHGPAPVKIALRTTRLGRSSFEQAYRISCAETGTVWAEATATLVMWNGENRCSCEMPDDFRAALAGFEGL
ncbi:MAG: acyl-CoA thioesterase [Planctomycetes bacterium]|jgi:acyl-CoA thioester hydrolase|nr:acyl-CoA thioesterase [Planctomycetota bacterium]MBT4028224.1 acyl-CoA thioesterase [Planctomycetota bacterium]MBT4560983.1 acyl-CoA thioesterase [Planctomycetota bacterium]MBT5102055.1 acyl-CoA thioesterase [Planctomycetota bacterium]MBT5119442.1 acyl-CoA thioesterase [Planctomycetota bacterium]